MSKVFLEQRGMVGEGRIMGTRSNVYVETEPGTYLGTYCHYDGYPSHMFPTLTDMDHDRLLGHILIAMTRGGFRTLDGPATEYIDDTETVIMTDPAMEDWGPDYVYIKRLDGKVQWRPTYDELNVGWRFTGIE
jgi:hypothetical protein